MKARLLGTINVEWTRYHGLKNRFQFEKFQQRIYAEQKSLAEKAGILRASDPQRVLERGFS